MESSALVSNNQQLPHPNTIHQHVFALSDSIRQSRHHNRRLPRTRRRHRPRARQPQSQGKHKPASFPKKTKKQSNPHGGQVAITFVSPRSFLSPSPQSRSSTPSPPAPPPSPSKPTCATPPRPPKSTPMENRIAKAEDVALVVATGAEAQRRWVTGQTVRAGGGGLYELGW